MFLKLSLMSSLIYFMILPNVFSSLDYPFPIIDKSFSNKTISVSTAESIEIKMPYSFMIDVSLIPSPIKSTTWLLVLSSLTINYIYSVIKFAKIVIFFVFSFNSLKVIFQCSRPAKHFFIIFNSLQIII